MTDNQITGEISKFNLVSLNEETIKFNFQYVWNKNGGTPIIYDNKIELVSVYLIPQDGSTPILVDLVTSDDTTQDYYSGISTFTTSKLEDGTMYVFKFDLIGEGSEYTVTNVVVV